MNKSMDGIYRNMHIVQLGTFIINARHIDYIDMKSDKPKMVLIKLSGYDRIIEYSFDSEEARDYCYKELSNAMTSDCHPQPLRKSPPPAG